MKKMSQTIKPTTLFQLLFLVSYFIASACSLSPEQEKVLYISAQNQATTDKINIYFKILDNVKNSDISSSYELPHRMS